MTIADMYSDDQFLYDIFTSPQYTDGGGVPGSTLSKRLAALKQLQELSGIPMTQLFGGGMETPAGPAPVNQTAQIYGSNPMYQEAFAAIDAGADPQTVYANLVQRASDAMKGSTDERVKAATGQVVAPGEAAPNMAYFDPNDEATAARVYQTLEDYAKGNIDVAQQQAEYDSKLPTFTLSNGKKYVGQPDVMGFSSEYDLLGRPEVGDLVKQYAAKRFDQGASGHKGGVDVKPGVERLPGGKTVSTEGRYGDSPMAKQMAKGWFQGRVDRSKTNMVRSDANADAMRRMIGLRTLLGM